MTETPSSSTDAAGTTGAAAGSAARKRGGGLAGMLLADLKSLASGLGVSGAASMKKAQLVDAIKAAPSGGPSDGKSGGRSGGRSSSQSDDQPQAGPVETAPPAVQTRTRGQRSRPKQTTAADQTEAPAPAPVLEKTVEAPTPDQSEQSTDQRPEGSHGAGRTTGRAPRRSSDQPASSRDQVGRDAAEAEAGRRSQGQPKPDSQDGQGNQGRDKQDGQANQGRDKQDNQNRDKQDNQNRDRQDKQDGQSNQDAQQNNDQGDDDGDGDGSGRRNRRRRGRDRTRTNATSATSTSGGGGGGGGGGGRNEPDTTVLDDDVLVPAAGILDVLDNYAFVRTSGYLPGVDDVYLSLSMVRKFGLRRGDAVVGQVRQPRDGERKEKFNPMVRIDTVNGADPDNARTRGDFAEMTPVHPDQRLRLETAPGDLIGRVIDLAAPIGKGQRALVVSPAHAGKTTLLRALADSVTKNNPECHLMVVLVDERPEEVTDFQRAVKGEVVASTFDRPPADHTIVAELAIERAKRLVELGHDVVVLLDGLTRLGRAYNLSAPAGGRALAGGVDASALYPPKRFFGAARNLEDGGSLTIIATATIESGSRLDELILDELGDTANAEVRLRRDLADVGLFPAVDLLRSGTRALDRLVSDQEREILDKLRRVLASMEGRAAAELLLERVRSSQTNVELLTRIQRAAPNAI